MICMCSVQRPDAYTVARAGGLVCLGKVRKSRIAARNKIDNMTGALAGRFAAIDASANHRTTPTHNIEMSLVTMPIKGKGLKKLFGWAKPSKRAPQPVAAPRSYHAVTIRYSQAKACEAVRSLAEQAFLSAEAPQLPLSGCSEPQGCRCQYRHQSDRRSGLRRDVDHGVGGRHYHGEERRSGRADRRKPA